jgi:hypothetical protein
MANTNEQLLSLLSLINNSKLISELSESTNVTTNDNYLVINKGSNNAQKIKIPLLRGVLGNYNASTNTPNLSNGTALAGDRYTVSVAGDRDFGSGTISLIVDDVIYYDGAKWIKITQSQISDIDGLQEALNSKISTSLGDEFYELDGVLYLNVSTYRQTINYTSGSQIFTLDFEPTFFIGIFINGVYLDDDDYIYTSPNQLEILGQMENGDVVRIIYEHFNVEPV